MSAGEAPATFASFGYGSLVNRRTLPPGTALLPGTLSGFRRAWRAASEWGGHGVCALSVEPAAEAAIDGVLLVQPIAALAALDAREQRYNRHILPAARFTPAEDAAPPPHPFLVVYRAAAAANRFGDAGRPIWLSYVDTVLQGFLAVFGRAGLEAFMATTDGWHVPIVDDRAAPAYPRATVLSAEETALVDAALAAAGARVVPRRAP